MVLEVRSNVESNHFWQALAEFHPCRLGTVQFGKVQIRMLSQIFAADAYDLIFSTYFGGSD
jgi:hypothetical protein